MQTRYMLGSLAISGIVLVAGTCGASADSAMIAQSGGCATIFSAKFEQWRQMRLLVDRSKTFADGSTRNDELIVTEDTAYKQDPWGWTSAGITMRQRAVPSPQEIARNMRLATCTQDGHDSFGGEPVTIYSYDYLPDDAGFVAHGRMWISDRSGLPVHEEFQEPAPPANAKVAKAISATYRYNGDVRIPGGAQVANATRLYNNQAAVRNVQSDGAGGLGGPKQ